MLEDPSHRPTWVVGGDQSISSNQEDVVHSLSSNQPGSENLFEFDVFLYMSGGVWTRVKNGLNSSEQYIFHHGNQVIRASVYPQFRMAQIRGAISLNDSADRPIMNIRPGSEDFEIHLVQSSVWPWQQDAAEKLRNIMIMDGVHDS